MSAGEHKDDSMFKLQKKLERKKRIWLAKNSQVSAVAEDNQTFARANYSFIKDWQDSLQQRSTTKKSETPIINDTLALDLAKRAHDKELKERRKEKTKTKIETKEFLPAIKTFVQKRSLLSKKKVDLSCGYDDIKREDALPPLKAIDNDSENELFLSDNDDDIDEENINNLEGIFLCGFKSDDAETNVLETLNKDLKLSKIPCFSSIPSVVIFKNFEVEHIYKQKIKLINVHSSPLSCKLIGIKDDEVNNFIDLEFHVPTGQIMPGMNCTMLVKFHPKDEDIDLDSSIFMKTELGLFSIPLEIRKKFCCVTVQPLEIDFGTHVIGSTSSQQFQIFNRGTKVANYYIYNSEKEKDADASQSLSKPFSINTSLANSAAFSLVKSTTISSPISLPVVTSDKPSLTLEENNYSNREFCVETGSQSLMTPSVEESSVPDFLKTEFDVVDLIGFDLNSNWEGQIAGKGKVNIEITYKPQIPGQVKTTFIVETSDFKAKLFFVTVTAKATLPHVSVRENSYNFNICAYNHLYQDIITLINDGNNKHDIAIELPKELRNHIDVIPKTGVIKPQSEFVIQIKLLAKNTLAVDAEKFFDESTGILEFPLIFHVSDQPMILKTSINAIISKTQIEFDPPSIDFGECYINESIQIDITMTNIGILTQQFGFVHVLNCISIEPNDGFGLILPNETIKLKIIFTPDIPVKYNSTLTCKTLFNRTFTIKWTGNVVNPPIKFSHYRIYFAATYLNNISTATIFMKNTKKDEKGSISYEFDIPHYCPVKISPNSGHILTGKTHKLNLIFCPKILQQQIQFEAMNIIMDSLPIESSITNTTEESVTSELTSATEKSVVTDEETSKSKSSKDEKISMKIILPNSLEYRKAIEKLTCEFNDRVEMYTISCYFTEDEFDNDGTEPRYSKTRPVKLFMSCPILKPKMKLLSLEKVDFGIISMRSKSFTTIEICNISNELLQVEAYIVNVQESFTLMKPKISIQGKSIGKFVVCFFPMEENEFFEKLDICCSGDEILSVILVGRSIKPDLILSFMKDDFILNLNYAIVGDYSTVNFTVTNPTDIDLRIRFQFTEHENEDDENCMNFNGLNPFAINPMQFALESMQSQSIIVIFSPDHNHHFLAWVKLILFDNYVFRKFSIEGIGSKSQMYLSGGLIKKFDTSLLLLSDINAVRMFAMDYEANRISFGPLIDDGNTICLVFTRYKVSNYLEMIYIQSHLTPVKKPAEFVIENFQNVEKLGFTFNLTKGIIDIGKAFRVMVTYHLEKFESLTATAIIKVKTDTALLNLTIYLYVK